MAFRATSVSAEQAFSQIRLQAANSRSYLTSQRALMVAPTVFSVVPLAVIQHFATVIPILDTLSVTPGIVEYAHTQFNDNAYDIVAEFTAMRNAMVSTRNNLIAMFPKDGNGFLLYQTVNASGILSNRTFTAAEVAPAVVLIDAVIATIV